MFNILKKIFDKLDEIIFCFTNLIFTLIPLSLMLFGSAFSIGVIILWFLKFVNLQDMLYILPLGILMLWVGFQWDRAVVKNYPTIRKKVEKSNFRKKETS